MRKQIVIYPTSANPPTMGHADLLKRACENFDLVYWVAAYNPSKRLLFSLEDRMAMMNDYIDYYRLKNVVLDHYEGAIVRYAISKGASFLLRGLRNTTDFQFEFDMSCANRGINSQVETLGIFADPTLMTISSGLVRELALLGENFDLYVIPKVAKRIRDFLSANPKPPPF